MSKVNIPVDLFELIQFGELIRTVNDLPKVQKVRFMVNDDEKTFDKLLNIVDKLQSCYNEALDDVGFTHEDHFKNKLDYPEWCNEVIDIINQKYEVYNSEDI